MAFALEKRFQPAYLLRFHITDAFVADNGYVAGELATAVVHSVNVAAGIAVFRQSPAPSMWVERPRNGCTRTCGASCSSSLPHAALPSPFSCWGLQPPTPVSQLAVAMQLYPRQAWKQRQPGHPPWPLRSPVCLATMWRRIWTWRSHCSATVRPSRRAVMIRCSAGPISRNLLRARLRSFDTVFHGFVKLDFHSALLQCLSAPMLAFFRKFGASP